MSVFETLEGVNVNGKTEKKRNGSTELTYLSWPFAWAEVKKRYEDASYEIIKTENGLPYVYDPLTGFMVYTKMTINGVTHEMWLPVMDGANKAMKAEAYTYKTKFGEKTCEAASMFDINKTIMRCLVKNIAMFGLGLYIFAGEDIPMLETEAKTAPISADKVKALREKMDLVDITDAQITNWLKIKTLDSMTSEQFDKCIKKLDATIMSRQMEAK